MDRILEDEGERRDNSRIEQKPIWKGSVGDRCDELANGKTAAEPKEPIGRFGLALFGCGVRFVTGLGRLPLAQDVCWKAVSSTGSTSPQHGTVSRLDAIHHTSRLAHTLPLNHDI